MEEIKTFGFINKDNTCFTFNMPVISGTSGNFVKIGSDGKSLEDSEKNNESFALSDHIHDYSDTYAAKSHTHTSDDIIDKETEHPSNESTKLITSGAVYSAIQGLNEIQSNLDISGKVDKVIGASGKIAVLTEDGNIEPSNKEYNTVDSINYGLAYLKQLTQRMSISGLPSIASNGQEILYVGESNSDLQFGQVYKASILDDNYTGFSIHLEVTEESGYEWMQYFNANLVDPQDATLNQLQTEGYCIIDVQGYSGFSGSSMKAQSHDDFVDKINNLKTLVTNESGEWTDGEYTGNSIQWDPKFMLNP